MANLVVFIGVATEAIESEKNNSSRLCCIYDQRFYLGEYEVITGLSTRRVRNSCSWARCFCIRHAFEVYCILKFHRCQYHLQPARFRIHFGVLVSNSRFANVTMMPTSPSPSLSNSTLALDPALILHDDNRRQYKPGSGTGFDLPSSVSLSGSFDFSPCLSPRRLGEDSSTL
uniref:Uncharacterized protein n=1 Tax=Moniliophthora roreri TaxID=221103 RepID=A0A0W0GAL4_MONRR